MISIYFKHLFSFSCIRTVCSCFINDYIFSMVVELTCHLFSADVLSEYVLLSVLIVVDHCLLISVFLLWISPSGNQGSEWHKATVDIPGNSSKIDIIFEAARGTSYFSDTAIDDVILRSGKCFSNGMIWNNSVY